MNRHSALAEGLAAASLSAFFFWGLRFLPVFGIAFVPAAGVPLVRFGTRHGWPAALAAGVAAALLSAAIGLSIVRSPADAAGQALALLFTAGSCGIAAGVARVRRPSSVFLGLCLYGAVAGAVLWSATPGANHEVESRFDTMTSQWSASMRQSGADAEMIARTQSTIDFTRRVILDYAAGVVAALWILLAAAAFFLGRRLARREPDEEGFSRFRLPPALAGVFVLAGAAAALFPGPGRRIAMDVLAPVLVLYFLGGLSIIAYFARRWFRTGILRAAVYVLASWPPFVAGTAVFGLFDWYFDFRKRADQRAIGRSE